MIFGHFLVSYSKARFFPPLMTSKQFPFYSNREMLITKISFLMGHTKSFAHLRYSVKDTIELKESRQTSLLG